MIIFIIKLILFLIKLWILYQYTSKEYIIRGTKDSSATHKAFTSRLKQIME